MATISRGILDHKVWNKTATPDEIALHQKTRARAAVRPETARNRRILLGVMANAARPLPAVLVCLRDEERLENGYRSFLKSVATVKGSMGEAKIA